MDASFSKNELVVISILERDLGLLHDRRQAAERAERAAHGAEERRADDRDLMTPGTPILDPLLSRNFGGLVLLCIEADFCEQGLFFFCEARMKQFSRSKRSTFLRTGRNSKLLQKFAWKFADFSKNQYFHIRFVVFRTGSDENSSEFQYFFKMCEEFSRFH